MFRNYLIATFRQLRRQRLSTVVNLVGLSVGLTLSLLIVGHVYYEMSFDNFHENRGRIYRVDGSFELVKLDASGEEDRQSGRSARVMAPLGQAIKDEMPEAEQVTTFRYFQSTTVEVDSVISEAGTMFCAGPEYLDIFTLPLYAGSAASLAEPGHVLITREAAAKYFRGRAPMGRHLTINGEFECEVTGILDDITHNSQHHCDFIVSYATLDLLGYDTRSWDQVPQDYVYLLLRDGADPAQAESKIASIMEPHFGPDSRNTYDFGLRPLGDIYLGSLDDMLSWELNPFGEKSFIYVLVILAAFVLVQAIANFVNLSTAKAADRMKEVGVRKTFGAGRANLIHQFLGESVGLVLIAMVVGLVGYELFKRNIEQYLPREMLADPWTSPLLLLVMVGFVLLVGLLAGFYPALYISRFSPIDILRSRMTFTSTKSKLRKGLVLFQFTLATFLATSTLIVMKQTGFITNFDLGFDSKNILVLDFDGDDASRKCSIMRQALEGEPYVASLCATSSLPGRESFSFYGFDPDDDPSTPTVLARVFDTDENFFKTFGIELSRGEDMSQALAEGVANPLVLNQAAADALLIDAPIGRRFEWRDKFWTVVGMVDDFRGSPMSRGQEEASIIRLQPDRHRSLALKLTSDDPGRALAGVTEHWNALLPGDLLRYSFLDDEIEAAYLDMTWTGRILLGLGVLTTLIACLGVFGLMQYATSRRHREIGIRKVLGGNVGSIVKLLSGEFLVLVVIANALGWAFTYLLTGRVMAEFPYQADIGIGPYILTAVSAIGLALVTAGYQAFRAAQSNPIDSLRCE